MRSIYQEVLGTEFDRLHPRIQARFGLTSEHGVCQIGRGIMQEVWHGPFYTVPFLMLGTWRNIMFPERGVEVPFTIENHAYRDGFGRETVTWLRRFETRRARRFDATMIHSAERGRIVDYLGTHQHLAVDLDLSVADNGGLRIRSGAQRFYEGPIAFNFPMLFSGVAEVCEWFDEAIDRFRISVEVTNPTWGRLFGYRGTFEVDTRPALPTHRLGEILPRRNERRE